MERGYSLLIRGLSFPLELPLTGEFSSYYNVILP